MKLELRRDFALLVGIFGNFPFASQGWNLFLLFHDFLFFRALGFQLPLIHHFFAIFLLLLLFREHLVCAFFQVLRRHLLAVFGRVNRLIEHKLVSCEVLRLRVTDFFQLRRHQLLVFCDRLHAKRHIDRSLQRIVRNGIDRFNNLGVVLEKIVQKLGAADFLLRCGLLDQIQTLFCKVQI